MPGGLERNRLLTRAARKLHVEYTRTARGAHRSESGHHGNNQVTLG